MKRWLLENLGLKVFSLAAATLLWLTFVASPELVTYVSTPIEYLNVPAGMEIMPESPERVRLEVRGTSNRIRYFVNSSPTVVLNLSGIERPGTYSFTVTAEHVNSPPGLTIVRAVPAQVRLRLERRLRRTVPIRAKLANLPRGYRISELVVEPASAIVVGPESHVLTAEFVETEAVEGLQPTEEWQHSETQVVMNDPELRLEKDGRVKVLVKLSAQVAGEKTDAATAVRP